MSLTPSASPALASGASVGTSPKFDVKSLYAIQNSRVEFGGGWEGVGIRVTMRNYVVGKVS
jgi:hypothetical protein